MRVHADVVAAAIVEQALVDVGATGPAGGLSVALVADALVGAHHVLAHAVGANTAGQAALVDVLR